MGKSFLVIALLLFLAVPAAVAMDGCGAGSCTDCHSLTIQEASELLRDVGTVKSVQLAPVKGLWLLDLEREGQQGAVFIDFGKKNLIAGTVFPLTTAKNGTTATPSPPVAVSQKANLDVAAIPLEHSIVLGNPTGTKKLFVFTDPECPFCKKMHEELKTLAAREPELAIYVKIFPLKMHPASFDKARVILGGNSRLLLEKAFAGLPLPPPGAQDLRGPVDNTIKLAADLGIDATPTLILPDGRLVVGFKDAAALQVLLTKAR